MVCFDDAPYWHIRPSVFLLPRSWQLRPATALALQMLLGWPRRKPKPPRMSNAVTSVDALIDARGLEVSEKH